MGRIRRKKDQLDAGILDVILNRFGAVVASVVANDVDPGRDGVDLLKLLEQGDR